MRVQIPVLVYVSRMTDGTVHRDIFPASTAPGESTADQRAMATMALRETPAVQVDRWDEYPSAVVYNEHI